jgi:uncharacterized protein YndB with AHSA1/START domain
MTDGESLSVERMVRSKIDNVFDAWVDPVLIPRWWGAGDVTCPEAQVDLRVGGQYRIANQMPDGAVMWIAGTFVAIDRPTRIEYTWAMETGNNADVSSNVVVTFEDKGDATNIIVVQTHIADAVTREIHLDGWVGCLAGLDSLLAS